MDIGYWIKLGILDFGSCREYWLLDHVGDIWTLTKWDLLDIGPSGGNSILDQVGDIKTWTKWDILDTRGCIDMSLNIGRFTRCHQMSLNLSQTLRHSDTSVEPLLTFCFKSDNFWMTSDMDLTDWIDWELLLIVLFMVLLLLLISSDFILIAFLALPLGFGLEFRAATTLVEVIWTWVRK